MHRPFGAAPKAGLHVGGSRLPPGTGHHSTSIRTSGRPCQQTPAAGAVARHSRSGSRVSMPRVGGKGPGQPRKPPQCACEPGLSRGCGDRRYQRCVVLTAAARAFPGGCGPTAAVCPDRESRHERRPASVYRRRTGRGHPATDGNLCTRPPGSGYPQTAGPWQSLSVAKR